MTRLRSPVLCALTLAATLATLTGCAHTSAGKGSDLVVFGTVETLRYEPLGELATDGRFTARLTISRVDRGRPPSSVMIIKYIAHSDLTGEHRFHLRHSEDGAWLACSDGAGRGYVCR